MRLLSPTGRPAVFAMALVHVATGCGQAPESISAASCTQAPRIDGRMDEGEWDEAARVAFAMAMASTDGPVAPRDVEFWVMSSSENLYMALRVPDPEREASLAPLATDVALLVFARGDQVAAGDDRKIVIPGTYVDKHLTAPGKDADDAAAHGRAAMVHDSEMGEYFIEWQFALDSGDGEDLAAKPGDRVRFNLVYADRFMEELAETEIGGLYGGDVDDATGWGYLVLAEDVTQEQPAPEPEWAQRLFPHTAAPDEFEHRFMRTEAVELPVGEAIGGQVTCEFIYRGIDGEPLTGHARIFVPPAALNDPEARAALVHAAGYELDPGGAAGLLAKGMAVTTPHAEPLNPLDRGPSLDIALLHAARRLAFVDDSRVIIQGGSAGGYTALMLAAETFPLICAMPDVPPVNWGYNAAYFMHNREPALAKQEGEEQPAMPILAVVLPLAEQAVRKLDPNTNADVWLNSSPLAQLDTLTAPLQVVFSTADILAPVDQVSADLVRPRDPGLFPASFTTAIDDLVAEPEARRTLLEALPEEAYELFVLPVPEGAEKLILEPPSNPPPVSVELPFSRKRLWSIVVIDEGPPEPDVGHFRYSLGANHDAFREWALEQGIQPDQLTPPKLRRLMMRLKGEDYLPLTVRPEGADGPLSGTRLDFPAAERGDVLRGLTTFASDDACARRLAELYGQLPADLRVLGPSLGDGSPESVRAALQDGGR